MHFARGQSPAPDGECGAKYFQQGTVPVQRMGSLLMFTDSGYNQKLNVEFVLIINYELCVT
jgi:hypothetical protein